MHPFAYIDGGSASFILQTIAATGLGAVYIVRNHIKRIFYRFRKGRGAEESTKE